MKASRKKKSMVDSDLNKSWTQAAWGRRIRKAMKVKSHDKCDLSVDKVTKIFLNFRTITLSYVWRRFTFHLFFTIFMQHSDDV